MPTTVYFASDRKLTGTSDSPASYSNEIQPPSDSTQLVYGTAFVSWIDIATTYVNAAQVRASQVRGRPATLRLYPQIVSAPGSTIRSADISVCPLPVGGSGCAQAAITPGCGHSFICDGR